MRLAGVLTTTEAMPEAWRSIRSSDFWQVVAQQELWSRHKCGHEPNARQNCGVVQTPTKHALNQTCSIQVQRVQASLKGKDVIAATAIKKQAEGHRYMFPPLDIWLSTTVMSCALKTPNSVQRQPPSQYN